VEKGKSYVDDLNLHSEREPSALSATSLGGGVKRIDRTRDMKVGRFFGHNGGGTGQVFTIIRKRWSFVYLGKAGGKTVIFYGS